MTAAGADRAERAGAGHDIDDGATPGPEALILGGTPIAREIRERVRRGVAAYRRRYGRRPVLAVLHLSRSSSFQVYARQIVRACERVGIEVRQVEVRQVEVRQVPAPDGSGAPRAAPSPAAPAASAAPGPAAPAASADPGPAARSAPGRGRLSAGAVRDRLRELSSDPAVDGIIVQQPLPHGIPASVVFEGLEPSKDVDGITPVNAGRLAAGQPAFAPATAQAVVEILDRFAIPLEGMHAVVVGRSLTVGRPVAQLLLRRNCTVTICHSRTRDLDHYTREADVLVVAAGRPGLIGAGMLRPGAIVVDVGTTVVDGRIVGDVDAGSARTAAGAITPVPGGIGPVTNAVLLEHVLLAARAAAGRR